MSENIYTIINLILIDIVQVLNYFPILMIGGLIWLNAYLLLYCMIWKKIKPDWKHAGLHFLAGIYFVALFQVTFFSRVPGSRIGIDLQILSTWGNDSRSKAYVIENILLFIPFGMYLKILLHKKRTMGIIILFAFLLSDVIEIMQLLTSRGYCQVDDLIANTLGAFLGACFVLLFRKKPTS